MKRNAKVDSNFRRSDNARLAASQRGAGDVAWDSGASIDTPAPGAEDNALLGRHRRLAREAKSASTGASRYENVPDEVAQEIRLRAARRKRARHRVRMRALMVLVPSLLISAFLMAATHVVMGDWRHWQAEVQARETQLTVLDERLAVGRRRLATLQAPKGREQLLIEHGFIPPGDRILLFPPPIPTKRVIAPNDLSPRSTSPNEGTTGSALSRATRSIGQWWRGWRGQDGQRAQ